VEGIFDVGFSLLCTIVSLWTSEALRLKAQLTNHSY
jgi:hypothetical protein